MRIQNTVFHVCVRIRIENGSVSLLSFLLVAGATGALQGVCWALYRGHDRGRPQGLLLQVWRGHGRLHPQTVQSLRLCHLPGSGGERLARQHFGAVW